MAPKTNHLSYDAMNTLPSYLVRCVLMKGGSWKGVLRCVCTSWRHVLQQHSKAYITNYVSSVPLIRWARIHRCPWNATICVYAAHGHLEVLQWARANGCPWNEFTCTLASEHGHLEVLQWARANGCPWDEFTCTLAAEHGHLEVLQWARANGCPWDEFTCTLAAEHGHLKVLQWARANECPWDVDRCLQSKYKYVTDWIKSVI